MPWPRMWRIRSSRSGCSIGSPPLKATTDVPSAASLSMRPLHHVGRHRIGHLVVLVAVAAVDVAAADRDDLDEQRMRGVRQAADELAHRPRLAAGGGQDGHGSGHRPLKADATSGANGYVASGFSRTIVNYSSGLRARRPQAAHLLADLERSREDRADRDDTRGAGAARRPRGRPRRCSRSWHSRESPPNWHGVIFVVRSAEMLCVVRANDAFVGRRGRLAA